MQLTSKDKIGEFLIFVISPIIFLLPEFTFIKLAIIFLGFDIYFYFKSPTIRYSTVFLLILLIIGILNIIRNGNLCSFSLFLIYIEIFLISLSNFDREKNLNLLFFTALIVSIIGIAQAIHMIPSPKDFYGKPDYSSVMGLSNYSAHFLGPLILPFIYLTRKHKKNYLIIGLIIIIIYSIIINNRALLAGIITSIIFIIFISLKTKKAKIAFIGALLILSPLIYISPPIQKFVHLKDFSARFRYYTYRGSIKLITDHPIGITGRFESIFPLYKPPSLDKQLITSKTWVNNPHSEPLFWGVDFGYIGIIFYIFLWVLFFEAIISQSLSPWIAGGILTGLIQSLVDFNFHTPAGALAFFFVFFQFIDLNFLKVRLTTKKFRYFLSVLSMFFFFAALLFSGSELYFRRGKFYYYQHNYLLAKEDLKKSVNLTPCRWEALSLLGNIYKKESFLLIAKSYYEKSLKYNPNFIPAIQHLGFIYYKLGYPQKAISIWSHGMYLSQYLRPQFAKRIFAILVSEKKYDEIKKIIKKYPHLLEKDKELRYYLKKYLEEQGGK